MGFGLGFWFRVLGFWASGVGFWGFGFWGFGFGGLGVWVYWFRVDGIRFLV